MGDRKVNLWNAISSLTPHVLPHDLSRVYESAAHGVGEQPRYYNMVLRASTNLEPHELLSYLQSLEQSLGRTPATHNQPRPIDIDILFYDDVQFDTTELTIPHPRLHERAFVLRPMEEIAPFHVHPKLRQPIIDLWDDIAHEGQDVFELESGL